MGVVDGGISRIIWKPLARIDIFRIMIVVIVSQILHFKYVWFIVQHLQLKL
jgi:hypothetical protein